MVIVQIATKNPTPVEDIKTSDLKPYQKDTQDPYITAYFKADALPFVIGDGTAFNYENKKYVNQPLKLNSNYIVFLRFFDSKLKVNSIKKPELNVQLDLAEIFYP
jgi:hypothetical protein